MDKTWQKQSFYTLLSGLILIFLFLPALPFPDKSVRIIFALFSVPLLFLCGTFLPCYLACGKNFLRELGLKVPGKADFLPVLSAIPLFFLFAAMTFLARSAGLPVSVQGLIGYAENCSPVMFFLILLTAGFLAPVSEEIAYRRTVYGFLRESFPGKDRWIAVFTSFLFAVSHGLIWQSISLFLLGLYLQWHQQKGSTTRAILIHAVFNWCSLTVLILIRAGILTGSALN